MGRLSQVLKKSNCKVCKGVIEMEIETYKELQSKGELLPLFQHAFWWPFNPTEFDKTIRTDPRLKDSPVGYAAIRDKQVAGFVGVMDIETRTTQNSVEKVGGIWGVVTHPAYARKGIFKRIKKLYDNRSRILHGEHLETEYTSENIRAFEDCVSFP